jgi:hypothetical protein
LKEQQFLAVFSQFLAVALTHKTLNVLCYKALEEKQRAEGIEPS